jgi:hypothetical protein
MAMLKNQMVKYLNTVGFNPFGVFFTRKRGDPNDSQNTWTARSSQSSDRQLFVSMTLSDLPQRVAFPVAESWKEKGSAKVQTWLPLAVLLDAFGKLHLRCSFNML